MGWLRSDGAVIAAIDDDDHAERVVEVAGELADQLGSPLIVVHVLSGNVPPGVSAAAAGRKRLRDEQDRDAHELLERLTTGHLSAQPVVAIGDAGSTLVQLAADEDASLLVIGSAGKGTVATALRGSVSHHVATNAPCPVIVVPATAQPSAVRVAADTAG